MTVQADLEVLRTKTRHGLKYINQALFQPANAWPSRYMLLLVFAALIFQILQPIVMADTDMWYHLSGGRLLWVEGKIPDHPYFSFAFADHKWIAYFWGFQALIYPIFDAFGYQGLVVTRALLFTASFALIVTYLCAGRPCRTSWALVALAILYLLLLDGRAYQLRPHLVSYAMIPLFLYILEHRRQWLPALPVLTVIWGNLHGVTWVIGATVVGAYFVEWSVARFRDLPDKAPTTHLLWLLACIPALLINPFGWELYKAPFAIPADLTLFISELQPLNPLIFFTVQISALSVGTTTLVTVLMLIVLASLLHSVLYGGLRLSHLILVLAGATLLTRGNRFLSEWALLSLPMAASFLSELRRDKFRPATSVLPALLLLALLAAPFHSLWSKLPDDKGKYPFNEEGLSSGITHFLAHQKATGNLLISPGDAGYINWALYPDILVFSDMQFPPFDSAITLEIFYAMSGDTPTFTQLFAQYPIDFVAVKRETKKAGAMLTATEEFKPVFFDDSFVLYANKQRQPALVEAHLLRHLNPHNLLDHKGTVEEQLEELRKIQSMWPSGRRVNHAISYILLNEKRYDEGLVAAERFLALYPDDPNSHYLVGDIHEQMNHFDQAIHHYRNAMQYSDETFKKILYRHIGACNYLNRDFDAAYDAFNKGVNPFQGIEDPETLYQYAFSATVVGENDRAKLLLRALLWTTPTAKQHTIDDARALLEKLQRGDLDDPGPMELLRALFNAPFTQDKPQ